MAQRRLSRKTKGSANRHKQKTRLAALHNKIANQRRDFEHKVSKTYVDKYDTIFVEDLSIPNMLKNHKLAKSISNISWYSFFQKLEYKAANAGILFRKVQPHHTSQGCSGCGKTIKKTLAQRTHVCDSCGLVLDRDSQCRHKHQAERDCNAVTHGAWGSYASGENASNHGKQSWSSRLVE